MTAPTRKIAPTAPQGPSLGARVRAWLATVDLARVLAASLFVSVLVFATVLWVTVHPLAGTLGALVPFAAWYIALIKAGAAAEAHERALRISEVKASHTLTRPSIPTRATLAEGGSVGPAQWRPAEEA